RTDLPRCDGSRLALSADMAPAHHSVDKVVQRHTEARHHDLLKPIVTLFHCFAWEGALAADAADDEGVVGAEAAFDPGEEIAGGADALAGPGLAGAAIDAGELAEGDVGAVQVFIEAAIEQ